MHALLDRKETDAPLLPLMKCSHRWLDKPSAIAILRSIERTAGSAQGNPV